MKLVELSDTTRGDIWKEILSSK